MFEGLISTEYGAGKSDELLYIFNIHSDIIQYPGIPILFVKNHFLNDRNIYKYIEREREREIERDKDSMIHIHICFPFLFFFYFWL